MNIYQTGIKSTVLRLQRDKFNKGLMCCRICAASGQRDLAGGQAEENRVPTDVEWSGFAPSPQAFEVDLPPESLLLHSRGCGESKKGLCFTYILVLNLLSAGF